MRTTGTPDPTDRRLMAVHVALAASCLLLLALLTLQGETLRLRHALVVGGTLLNAALIHVGLAVSLYRGDAWAREGSVRVAILLLTAVPFGTLIGVGMLWVAWGKDRPMARPKPRVPLIEAWPEAERTQATPRPDAPAP